MDVLTPEDRAAAVRKALDELDYYEGTAKRDAIIAAAIREAVLAEREACAKIAEAPAVTGDTNDWVQSTAFGIAAAIRARLG